MTSKRLYKVTLTGWVVKDENQNEVLEWPFDTIVDEMIGEQLTSLSLIVMKEQLLQGLTLKSINK